MELTEILNGSIMWNRSHEITGMLLYIHGGLFHKDQGRSMYVLEGSFEEVDLIFEKIRHDNRHGNLQILSRRIYLKEL